ncbi:glycoside hydrolase family 13 protein [Synechococcus sp. MIT S9452]|uniref:glycoside hydrolase family 13 protein n=1 Tax=Synechococcus sp. MIT S9452 TaxID=3082546 RepID=UPI0039A53B25
MPPQTAYSDPPAWVGEAVIYQIFPDRFRRSGRVDEQNLLALKPWGSDPTEQGFQGGDLYGVIDALDHLQSMGMNCLYLTPIFSSAANHRYHAYDYLQVDPLLGGNEALDALIGAVHHRGMRIVLDGVFNHCGRGFWAFHHVVENGAASPYRDWFHIQQWPLKPYPSGGESCGYDCWWAIPDLPKFNHANPAVVNYLLSVARHWLERGIDGWRLDVPDEVPQKFWVDFRQAVREVNADAWIVGEIWGDARSWLQGDQFDGVMNYRIGWSTLGWAGGDGLRQSYQNPDYPLQPRSSEELLNIWSATTGWYRPEVNRAQLNLLDSHDVPRALHSLNGDLKALKLALLLLFLQPGAPCIYYGTEAGLAGGPNSELSSGPEPACREAFPWDQAWSADLSAYIQQLAELRRCYPVLQQGELSWRAVGSDGLVAKAVGMELWINRSRHESLALPNALASAEMLWSTEESTAAAAIAAQSAAMLLTTPK